MLNSSQAISRVNFELKTNVSYLRLHRQGRCCERPHVADIHTSL
jgi:hypothetical protein